jgi:hypothetical protein
MEWQPEETLNRRHVPRKYAESKIYYFRWLSQRIIESLRNAAAARHVAE